MNIDPVTRGLIDKFAPHLGKQIDAVKRVQIAFSEALTPEQQGRVRTAIQKGEKEFSNWAKSDTGIAAIRAFADAFTGVPAAPKLPPEPPKEKPDDVA